MRYRTYNRQSSVIDHLMGLLQTREWRNLADAPDLGSAGQPMGVRVPLSHHWKSHRFG